MNDLSCCTVIYDSECALCIRFKKALELIDIQKQVRFISLHENQTYIDFPELKKEECEEFVHLIDEENKIYIGGYAISYLVNILPGVKKFSWLLDSDSGLKASNAFYKRINEMRMMKKRNCFTCGHPKSRS